MNHQLWKAQSTWHLRSSHLSRTTQKGHSFFLTTPKTYTLHGKLTFLSNASALLRKVVIRENEFEGQIWMLSCILNETVSKKRMYKNNGQCNTVLLSYNELTYRGRFAFLKSVDTAMKISKMPDFSIVSKIRYCVSRRIKPLHIFIH